MSRQPAVFGSAMLRDGPRPDQIGPGGAGGVVQDIAANGSSLLISDAFGAAMSRSSPHWL